ncbi:hypothetical protein X975_04927, partial [Stegodyphus mimosarum]
MTEIVHTLTKQLKMSESKKREFQKATLEDEGLMLVKEYWQNGCPLSVDKVPKEARSYFKFKNELRVEQDLVFFSNRIVVPVALRKCINLSPSQKLLSRNLRTRLPITQTELKPTVEDQCREKVRSKQKQAKIYYDKHARERPEFSPGEKVMLRWENKWELAIVLKKHSTPRSYWIRTKDNKVIRRNKFHLRKTKNQKNLVTLEYYDLGKENEENISSEHPKIHNDPHHQDKSNNINRDCVYKTRSGRNVYRPSKYHNYIMH